MRKYLVPLTILFTVLGFLLAQELQMQNALSVVHTDERSEVLISLITNLEAETASLEEQLTNLRTETEKIISHSSTGESQLPELQNQLGKYQMQAGLTALEGPGIRVSLDDNAAGLAAAPTEDANRYIVHYEKILNIINDLRSAGAEAISVNGQRIVTSSEIRCVGNVILVNTTRLAPPFEISAIGEPGALEKAIINSRSYDSLRASGFPVSYKTTGLSDTLIQLPAYTGSFSTKYLSIIPLEEEDAA